jgi:hypothetical protein
LLLFVSYLFHAQCFIFAVGLVKPDDNQPALDGMPYTTLAYANGPGINHTTGRDNLTDVDTGAYCSE